MSDYRLVKQKNGVEVLSIVCLVVCRLKSSGGGGGN